MSAFTVPFSSSPPSTPDSRARPTNGLGNTSQTFGSNISTTPAEPPSSTPARPPSSFAPSFTPAGPPPLSSLFGSSQFGPSHNKLLFGSKARSIFSSPVPPPPEDEEMEEESDGEVDQWQGDGLSEAGSMAIEGESQRQPDKPVSTTSSRFQSSTSSAGGIDWAKYASSAMSGTPRGVKRSRGGAAISYHSSRSVVRQRDPRKDSSIPTIAKDMATQLGVAGLVEPDDLIVKSEKIINQLYHPEEGLEQEPDYEALLSAASQELSKVWQESRDQDQKNTPPEPNDLIGIGPEDSAPDYHKASFLGALLMQLHHPPTAKGMQAFAVSKFWRSSNLGQSLGPTRSQYRPTAPPKVLMDWLNERHNPYADSAATLKSHLPDPTAHMNYWDIIYSSMLRGKISDVISIFKRSSFEKARTAREDGQGGIGYHDMTLKNIKRVIDRAVQVLEMCPAVQDDDWNIAGNEWLLFRKRIDRAVADLTTFAEGRDRDAEPSGSTFEASNFGIKNPSLALSQSARRAESQVPWTIYQNLKAMYGIILGGDTEVVASAQDWVEATIGLAVWWNGDEDEEIAVGSLALTRRSLRRSQSRGSRFVDINPTEAYLQRLAHAFESVTDDEDGDLFQINSMNPVEVGLASIFQGNVEGVFGLLRGMSLPVASAVVEVACLGNWYTSAPSTALMDDFDESDLLVLSSYGQQQKPVTRDGLLIEYAEALVEREQVKDSASPTPTEGWELSMELLARLQDARKADKKVSDLIKRLPLDSDHKVDKVLQHCHEFEMHEEAHRVAERYADYISTNTTHYGTALIYYSRAHLPQKVKSVLDLLVSLCLVQSTGIPPAASLDKNLRALVETPQSSLKKLELLDTEAAATLHRYLTGYATLRRFYDLRDGEVNANGGEKPRGVSQRKKEAAKALIAVINSAADNIHGGLYDETRDSVVHVDGLLALLGEATVFVNHNPPLLTPTQSLSLLTALESLQTVSPISISTQCAACLASTLSAYHSPSPSQDLLSKTISSLTASSSGGFSLVGSEMLESGSSGSVVQVAGEGRRSGVGKKGEQVKRGWDWRGGWRRDARGEEILRGLRMGLARGIGRGWVLGEC